MDWEALYRALVRRLVEIADDTAKHFDYQSEYVEWHPTVNDFIKVARAHEKTIELYSDDRMIAGVDDDPISKEALLAAEGAG